MDDSTLATRFMELFAGLNRAHGYYAVSKKAVEPGEKRGGKALTKQEPVTVELWVKHLKGEQGLGIIPVRDDGTVRFASIDVDVYPLDLIALEQKVVGLNLPLLVFKTKSGGAHLVLFCAEDLSAKYVRGRLAEWAALLGYPGVEIFPKQNDVNRPGDVGNWINMPYYGATRPAIYDGRELTVEEFLEVVQKRRVTKAALDAFIAGADEYFEQGPPCLQHLAKSGFPRGTRNRGLFNLGVFARFSADDNWRERLDAFNLQYMTPPLSTSEVTSTAKSLSRKTYFYTCSQDPIASVCNKDICRTRKYGIGNQEGAAPPVMIDAIIKVDSSPPVYVVKIEGVEFECSAPDLLNQQRFKVLVLEKANRVVPILRQPVWDAMLNEKLAAAEIHPAPKDAGPEGQFESHLENFCTSRVTANKLDEILLGKPFVDTTKNRTYFRSPDLLRYLEQQHFREFNERQVWAILKRLGCEHHQFMLKGKCVTAWSIPNFKAQDTEFDLPPVEGDDL